MGYMAHQLLFPSATTLESKNMKLIAPFLSLAALVCLAPPAWSKDNDVQKDRIDDRAGAKKDRIDRDAEKAKDKVDNNANRAKDRVDGKATDTTKNGPAEEITDSWITTKIKASFVGEDLLKDSSISVDTERSGNVVLTGTAPSVAGRLRAGTIAAGVKGVKSVRNDIRVVAAK